MTDADTLRAVAELAKGGKGSPELAPLLERSGCFYLLSRLGKTGKLQRETVFNALCAKERYRACAPVLEKLEEASIPYAVIKGAVLSQAAYGSVSFRHSSDLDLLVSRSRADALRLLLPSCWWVCGPLPVFISCRKVSRVLSRPLVNTPKPPCRVSAGICRGRCRTSILLT